MARKRSPKCAQANGTGANLGFEEKLWAAADKHRLEPRTVSFKGAVQILEAFQPLIATQGDCSSTRRQRLYEQLLDAVATHRVGDRPDRFEPRQRKRRQKKYDRMMKPRNVLKREMLKGVR